MPLNFFPYLGGKHFLVKQLLRLIPEHEIYVEVFGGSASLLLNKPKSPIEVYNDLNGELVNLFAVVRDRPLEFISRLEPLLYSRELYEKWRKEFAPGEMARFEPGADPVERAVKFYFCLRANFAGRVWGGWAFARTRGFRLPDPAGIWAIHERLKRVYIDHLDYKNCIKNWDSPHTFFYLDPPYLGLTSNVFGWREKEHEELAGTLGGVKGKWLLTCNDHPLIRKLYARYSILEAKGPLLAKKVEGKPHPPLRHLIIKNY